MATIHKCACGRRMSKWATMCERCHNERMARVHAEAQRIVSTGRCPQCGQPLVRNSAMAGWWQCSGYGAEGFRAAGSTPCSFQTFTE
jgi:hypothetical protein